MGKINDLLLEVEGLREQEKLLKAYIEYLKDWYKKQIVLDSTTERPASFDSFLSNEYKKIKETIYVIRVDILSSSHDIAQYYDAISVVGPAFMNEEDLKRFINTGDWSIEDYIVPQADTNDVVNVEIYDYDIEIIERINTDGKR